MLAAVVPEAKLMETEHGLLPEGEGWFVVNAREARWITGEAFGLTTRFEGDHEFPHFGVNVRVLESGKPNCYYHGERHQEAVLVLDGECLLLVEGEERRLQAWDFVNLPPWTDHVLVGADDRTCLVAMVGGRFDPDEVAYPVSELARRHSAGVERETTSAEEAYAAVPRGRSRRYREGDLP